MEFLILESSDINYMKKINPSKICLNLKDLFNKYVSNYKQFIDYLILLDKEIGLHKVISIKYNHLRYTQIIKYIMSELKIKFNIIILPDIDQICETNYTDDIIKARINYIYSNIIQIYYLLNRELYIKYLLKFYHLKSLNMVYSPGEWRELNKELINKYNNVKNYQKYLNIGVTAALSLYQKYGEFNIKNFNTSIAMSDELRFHLKFYDRFVDIIPEDLILKIKTNIDNDDGMVVLPINKKYTEINIIYKKNNKKNIKKILKKYLKYIFSINHVHLVYQYYNIYINVYLYEYTNKLYIKFILEVGIHSINLIRELKGYIITMRGIYKDKKEVNIDPYTFMDPFFYKL